MPVKPCTKALFAPDTIAVLGDCCSDSGLAWRIVANLATASFEGKIFPVAAFCQPFPGGRASERHTGDPTAIPAASPVNSIAGIPVLASVEAIPAWAFPLDLAVLSMPAAETPAALRYLAQKGLRAAVVVNGGFKETGSEGAALEKELVSIAEKHSVTLLGPGSLGLVCPASGLQLALGHGTAKAGGIGFFSHSCGMCSDMLDWGQLAGLGFSAVVNLGNRAGLDEADMLAYFADDPNTRVIVGYTENIIDGRKFLEKAQFATRKKPVIILRPGRTPEAIRAACAHSDMAPSADMAYEAAFRQAGIIRAEGVQELFAMASIFSSGILPRGPGVAVVTNSGGAGIIAADATSATPLCLSKLSQATLDALRGVLPPYAAIFNPVEVRERTSPELLAQAATIVLGDPAVHSLLLVIAGADPDSFGTLAAQMQPMVQQEQKPVVLCVMRSHMNREAINRLEEAGMFTSFFPESAVSALARMYTYSLWQESPLPVDVYYRYDHGRAHRIIETALKHKNCELPESQSLELLRAYEMPVLETKLARTSSEAMQIAKHIGRPVHLILASTVARGSLQMDRAPVCLDSPEKVGKAFRELTGKNPAQGKQSHITGCLVQACPPPNCREVVIGFKRDRQFGPIVYFGLAGNMHPNGRGITCRPAPLGLNDAPAMVRENLCFPLLMGTKGYPAIQLTALEDALLIMSALAVDCPEIAEAECDPMLVNEHGAYAMKFRVYLKKNGAGNSC